MCMYQIRNVCIYIYITCSASPPAGGPAGRGLAPPCTRPAASRARASGGDSEELAKNTVDAHFNVKIRNPQYVASSLGMHTLPEKNVGFTMDVLMYLDMGFETLKLKFRELKLRELTVGLREMSIGSLDE